MAINYQRVGWEDAPSINTPLDAANLNHMDNGIVALSNEFDRVIPGLEEIAETVAPLLPNMSTMAEDITTLQGQTSALATQAQHILGNFATVEEGETASKNYSTGQYVVLGDYLYKVTADVAQGESFVENTNIEKTTVGSEMENRTPILIKKSFSETVSTTPLLMYVSYALPSGYTIVSTYLVSNNAPWIAKGIETQSNSTTGIYLRSLSGGNLSVSGTIIILALPSVNEMVGT